MTSITRSENMRRIRSKDTKPEMVVRRLAYAMGFRYRLHRKELAGKPDMVFPARRKLIFVHGCFWHHHHDTNCKDARLPKSRLDYWVPKLHRNVARDEEHIKVLRNAGWGVLVIWECETNDVHQLAGVLKNFLQ